jgi:hypothetical protein
MVSNPDRSGPRKGQASLVPGMVLLIVAAVLIVVVLINPAMPHWLRVTIAVVAICVVLALLGYVVLVFRSATRRGSRR